MDLGLAQFASFAPRQRRQDKSLYILFEGAINKNPTKLQDIKPGLFNYHKYSNGIKFIGLKGIDKIWPAKGQPYGYGTI